MKFFGNHTFTSNYHSHEFTYELMNKSSGVNAAKSAGEKYGFTQELFNIPQQIDEFFTFIFFIFLLPCCT